MFRTIALFAAALCAAVVLFVAGQAAVADGISPPEKKIAEKKIEEALDSPTEVEVIEMPLGDVMDFWKDRHAIEIQLDIKALDDVGISSDEPITKRLKGLSLRSALNLVLADLELTYLIANEVLWITTPEQAGTQLLTEVYPVADLIDGNGDALIHLITSAVQPDSWDDVGGPGNITGGSFGGAETVVISQTYHVHREIVELLAKLRKVAADSSPTARAQPQSNTQVFWPRSEAAGKIELALASETEVEFVETPLCEAIEVLKERHNIEIHIDRKALDDVGVSTDEPITLKLKGISLRAALRLMLRELALTFMIQDEVLLITTPEQAETQLSTRIYPVCDLIAGSSVFQLPQAGWPLAKTISQTFAPDSWDAVGGPGSISTLNVGGVPALIISQTLDVHDEIGAWLIELRRMVAASKDKLPKPTCVGRHGCGCIHQPPAGIGGGGGFGGGFGGGGGMF